MFETLSGIVDLINSIKEFITQPSFVLIALAYLAIKNKSRIAEFLN
ncbi:hypothetical protein ACFLFF_28840 [Brevibacillus reuszeri]